MQKAARKPLADDFEVIRTWWSNKYGLPPNDDRFLKRPLALHVRDLLSDLADRLEQVKEDLKTAEFREREKLAESRAILERILGIEAGTASDWHAEVERALAEGRAPDLDAI